MFKPYTHPIRRSTSFAIASMAAAGLCTVFIADTGGKLGALVWYLFAAATFYGLVNITDYERAHWDIARIWAHRVRRVAEPLQFLIATGMAASATILIIGAPLPVLAIAGFANLVSMHLLIDLIIRRSLAIIAEPKNTSS
jgi:hypothetical protein